MKKNLLAYSLCLLATAIPGVADTITLKDGKVLQGKVLSETSTEYLLEVQVTASIKDERKIAKTDVAKIDRERPETPAFNSIAKLIPSRDFLTAAEYATQIKAVEKFLADFRLSPKAKEATAILTTLKAEAETIGAGGIKLNGTVITAAAYQSNAYEIDARVLEAKIYALSRSGQTVAALRALESFNLDFSGTQAASPLSAQMVPLIKSYLAEVEQAAATIDMQTKERATGLGQMPLESRKNTEAAIKEEMQTIESTYLAEKAAKQNWPTLGPLHKPSHADTLEFGKLELTRLTTAKILATVDTGKVYRDAYATASQGDPATSASAIATAKTALIPPRYLEMLGAKAKASMKQP
jgi:hypothetical protein